MHLKLGTRKSLLAWAQSSWVAREVERLNPGTRVDLIGIETQGDRIQHIPLSAIDGKEFFVKEIDEALRTGAVDFTVHSMKDLSLDRPLEFITAAIPPRENPRDVVLFRPDILTSLRNGKTIRIGSSSPRRLENIPPFLKKALPFKPTLEFIEIRGNVNSRLARVHEPHDSPRALDAVVLAFAGIIRLWRDDAGRRELTELLRGVRWMILPLNECPAAPAQGALAIECRKTDARAEKALAKLHDAKTARLVALEREVLRQWGGGCHQRFGATAVEHKTLKTLHYIRGKKPDHEYVNELRWQAPAGTSNGGKWDGSQFREKVIPEKLSSVDIPVDKNAVFLSHARALPEYGFQNISDQRIFTSGVSSWFKLAENGLWVEGCAENLGFDWLEPTLAEPVLGVTNLYVLTHESAVKDWPNHLAIATYRLPETLELTAGDANELSQATHIFWSSGSQFEKFKHFASPHAHHACGAGKTARVLELSKVKMNVFPSVEEWRKWITARNSV